MKKSFFKYIAALLLFGSNGIVASFIALSSHEIVLLRTLIGSMLLIALFFASGKKITVPSSKKQYIYLALSGIAMGASWMFLYEAYDQIGVSIASLLYYCGPVFVVAFTPILFKERLSKNSLLGFAAVLVGIILVNGASEASGNVFGFVCGIMSALMYSIMVICNKKATEIVGLENSMLQLFVSFITVAIFVGSTQGYSIHIEGTSLLPILILGLINTGIGCYFYFSSIGDLSVQSVAICGYLEPLSAVFFSTLLLNEEMTPYQIVGAILIIGGAVASEFKRTKAK